MNKEHLSRALRYRTLLSKKEANQVINELFEIILQQVANGNEVNIVGFGKFYPYVHNARPVRNPKTLEEMTLQEYTTLKFKPSDVVKKLLKDKFNDGIADNYEDEEDLK